MGNRGPKPNKRKADQDGTAPDSAPTKKVAPVTPASVRAPAAPEPTILHSGPRQYTVSMALPGSIVENAQSAELRTYLVGQVARAAAVANVDEIVIYDDRCEREQSTDHPESAYVPGQPLTGLFESAARLDDANLFMARVLQYMEAPQYIRREVFPRHPDLQYAGLLNPLDSPNHVRQDEPSPYREAIVRPKNREDGPCYAYCGFAKLVRLDRHIAPDVRVTVKMNKPEDLDTKFPMGEVVSPRTPVEKDGIYWGYQVRLANSLSKVLSESPYEGGYDLTIGTSERGEPVSKIAEKTRKFKHVLVMFGGVAGIESAAEPDPEVTGEASKLFDYWINTCPDQGSRTIRTEEAILVSMAALRNTFLSLGVKS
ncbi:hypothetical protein IWQ60_002108 [Tieghemiomyces parasiticus]|uniref:Methyltransferase n=1 Tax=Tieghemiomyces parasiticus TaxID=78921 RepID=A0A9W8ACX4_9FUNG|nr:hypothetical protein IWQ60_002108 [Tieghemiomyces parasiticus]